MDSRLLDFVRHSTTGTGTGNLTLSSFPVSGYAAASYTSGDTVYYSLFSIDAAGNPSGEYEVGAGTLTSSSGNTILTRNRVFASSNSNNLVNFSAGTKHFIASAPDKVLSPAVDNNFRLSLQTGEPTPNSVTGASNLYLTPYNGDIISIYNATHIERHRRDSQLNITLSGLTSGKLYDVFAYVNSGIFQFDLGTAWTNNTTRALALTDKQGRLKVNNASFTTLINGHSVGQYAGTYLGTIRASGTTTTEDEPTKRFVWNRYNKVPRQLKKTDTTASWNYTTATWREVNGTPGNKLEYIVGLSDDSQIDITHHGLAISSSGASLGIGIGLDWSSGAPTTPYHCQIGGGGVAFNRLPGSVRYFEPGTIGYHYLQMLEIGGANGTFLGSGSATGNGGSMLGWIMG